MSDVCQSLLLVLLDDSRYGKIENHEFNYESGQDHRIDDAIKLDCLGELLKKYLVTVRVISSVKIREVASVILLISWKSGR